MTKTQALSLFYYPTTVILVDEDEQALSRLQLQLDEKLAYQTYSEPQSVLTCLLSEPEITATLPQALLNIQAGTATQTTMDISLIHQEIYDRHRFERCTVVLIKQHMKKISGIDFCKALADHPVKKILIVESSEVRDAIQAFNQGTIDHFIVRQSPHFFDQINQHIHTAQQEYFQEESTPILSRLTQQTDCLLGNTNYQRFLSAYCQQNQFSEYYLADSHGSFLFLDYHGIISWLIIKSAKEIDRLASTAEKAGGEGSLLNALKEKQKIPFFFNHENAQISVTEWGRYCHDAYPIPGCSGYYYADYKQVGQYNIYTNEIVSHQSYLAQQQPVVMQL